MRDTHDIAQFLVSCWMVSGSDNTIPTSHGLLDRALKLAVEHDACPTWVRERLHFVDSRVGLQCVELPTILDWAQMAEMTSVPNPSYQKTNIKVSSRAAQTLLRELDMSSDDAIKWGQILRDAVISSKNELEAYDLAGVEEY